MALLTGWMYPAGAGISWFANPLLILARIFIFKKEKLSVMLSFFACLFALSFLSFHKVMSDEAGHYSNVVSIGLGYGLWLSACVVCSIGSTIILFISRQKK